MVKESILFVVSTGLLIYFVTPSEDSAKPEATAEVAAKPVNHATPAPADVWDYDDGEGTDEGAEFVFGEPLTSFDNDYDAAPAVDEEKASAPAQTVAAVAPTPSRRSTVNSRNASGSSPQPDEQGGVNNPIILDSGS